MNVSRAIIVLFMSALAACGDGGSLVNGPVAGSLGAQPAIEALLREEVSYHGMTGDPAAVRGLRSVRPDSNKLVKLGQVLFFSHSLSGSFDVACATCHLPQLGGSDALSLSVGVVPEDRAVVGAGRRVDVVRDQDPQADGGPNMHRNSISTFNAALFDRVLMYDGRIRVADSETRPGGKGQLVLTTESGAGGDLSGVNGLLEAVAKFPITNENEMRGFLYADISHPDDFRGHLIDRLKGNVDQEYLNEDASGKWLSLFREGFGQPDATPDDVVTLLNLQRAIAAYIESQIFVDTPWRAWMNGDSHALTDSAKKGALLFLRGKAEGGLGCAACHKGDRFTNESFYNVGFPQLGRGFQQTDGSDRGRWMVTREENDRYAHRVPSLLNVSETAPYGHAGAFQSLRDLLRYHVNPLKGVEEYDFTLSSLTQFKYLGLSYPDSETLTRKTL